ISLLSESPHKEREQRVVNVLANVIGVLQTSADIRSGIRSAGMDPRVYWSEKPHNGITLSRVASANQHIRYQFEDQMYQVRFSRTERSVGLTLEQIVPSRDTKDLPEDEQRFSTQ